MSFGLSAAMAQGLPAQPAMTAQSAAAQYQQPPQQPPAQSLVAGPGQPPSTWSDILGLRALAEGQLGSHDLAQAGLQRAAQGNHSLGGALALSLAAFANAKGRERSSGRLGEAMAKEKDLERHYRELERLEEQRRQDEIDARDRQRALEDAARARRNAQADRQAEWAREDTEYSRERADDRQDAERDRGWAVEDRLSASQAAGRPTVRPPTAAQAREAKKTEINIDEGLRLLDDFEKQLDNSPRWRDTGPIDGLIPGKYTQNLEALTKQFFPIAKSLMRSGGEGPFTDKDAEDLMRALMSPGKYSDVNREIIGNWRRRLNAYQEGLGSLDGVPVAPDAPEGIPAEVWENLSPEARQYIK